MFSRTFHQIDVVRCMYIYNIYNPRSFPRQTNIHTKIVHGAQNKCPPTRLKKQKAVLLIRVPSIYMSWTTHKKRPKTKKQCGSKKSAINLWASSSPLNALQREHLASQLQAFIAYNKKWNKNIGLQYLSRPHRAVAQTEQLSIRVLVATGNWKCICTEHALLFAWHMMV